MVIFTFRCAVTTGLAMFITSIALFILLFAFQGTKPDTPCAGNFGPVTYLHRGNLHHAQENTFDSIVTGSVAQNGMNPEIDVSVLKDGGVVLFHDKSMKRMTGMDKKLKDATTEEVLNTNILSIIDGYDYNTTNKIPRLEPVVHAICNADKSIGINFDTKAKGAVCAEVQALKSSNCTATSEDNTIWSTPYPGVVNRIRKELKENGLANRIAIYMPAGNYAFLGLKFFLKTRLFQGLLASGSSILEVHKLVFDKDPDMIQAWKDDGWCVGIWGITPDEVDSYDADVYIVDEAPEFPDLVGTGRLGEDGDELEPVAYDDNTLVSYYCLIAATVLLWISSFAFFTFAWKIKTREVSKLEETNSRSNGVTVEKSKAVKEDENTGDIVVGV